MSNSIAIGVAYQDQDITGGSLNDSPIGATTPSTGAFTSIALKTSTVAAAGSTNADAAAMTTGFNLVTAADATKGVILPNSINGTMIYVKNSSASALKVYPDSGAAINALTATTGYFTSEEAARRNAKYIGGSIRQSEPVSYQAGYRSRVDADGKKMLLIEEVQSDWHQAGREIGYRKQGDKQALEAESKAIGDERNRLVKELSEQEKQNGFVSIEGQQQWDAFKEKENLFKKKYKDFSSQAPDAPFKDTWYQLALKRLTKYAADNGYERIGLTTGKQQAKRYDLGNEVNSIDVESVAGVPNLQLVDVDVIGGKKIALEIENGVVREGEFAGKRLSDVVGKEMADKITNVAQGEAKIFAGEDLRIGGEGMKKYYDEIYPAFLDKQAKKWNSKTGETRIKTGQGIPGGAPVRYIDITPEMKGGLAKGQPLHGLIAAPAVGLSEENRNKLKDIIK